MGTINERIRKVVELSGLSKTAFAQKINVSQQYISKLVNNGTPSDRTISDICREFGVNEIWLRTGVGEMFAPLSRAEEIAEFIGKTLSRGTPFQQAFISVLARTTPEEWAIFEKKLLELAEEMKKTDP
ncbi:MAG: helix-turn-helix transcriptional regulator [Oscillospiraceae bacterium]|nr:helix-turn-helix transcriptional regulator [Oscillospiraceae bacterium]